MSVGTLEQIVDALFDEHDALIDAVVADGWPREMAVEGFAMHRRTWRPRIVAAAIASEAAGEVPHTVAHLWPALPGAGVTPVLFAHLLGVSEQRIKPSRRGLHFANYFVRTWQRFDDSVSISEDWRVADRVVVSGSDETVTAVIQEVGEPKTVGYGHRVSFAVVADQHVGVPEIDGLATDIVMWHTTGCFSARAVIYDGPEHEAQLFGRALADAIARAETRLGATKLSEAQLSLRMQRLGKAEFETSVWRAELGWVERRDEWNGERVGPHAVVLCIGRPESVVGVNREHMQGVAWVGPQPERAEMLGATRVCAPGELQQPPPDWAHDGVGNVAALTGLANGRIGSLVPRHELG